MNLAEALEFTRKLAAGDYTRNQLDHLLDYLRTADRSELESFLDVYNEAIHELPDPGPVNPDFMDRLYALYPGRDGRGNGDGTGEAETDELPVNGPENIGANELRLNGASGYIRRRGLVIRRGGLAPIRYKTIAAGLAAMVALAAIGLWVWKPGASNKPPIARKTVPEKQEQIIPGGNKAVLTLAGGKQIILDSLQNGSIALQGNAHILKLTSGRLAYQADHTGSGPAVYNTITTPNGGQYQVWLPDGSKVWLNAASSLRFPTVFNGNEREVEMTGEVYFEIAKNQEKPFTVKSGGFSIQVLGTNFDVNAYADEAVFKTTLLQGAVSVRDGLGSSLLEPGEQAIATDAEKNIRVLREADTEEAIAWKNGRFQFSNADIPTIMRQIARWYDVDVHYEGNIPMEHFTGEVSRYSSLDKVLKIFALSQIHFRIEGKKIVVVA